MVKARSLLSRWKTDSPRNEEVAAHGVRDGDAGGGSGNRRIGPADDWDLAPTSPTCHRRPPGFVPRELSGWVSFLGMRHSTDPDHVVAVSTIVSRERSVKQGAVIGMMWGFGHTLTIFIVGAADHPVQV